MHGRITAGVSIVPAVFLAFGCMTGGAELPEDSPLYGTPNTSGELMCRETSVDSPTDMACHEDCVRPCGYDGRPHYTDKRADKYCICQGGVFIECRCPRPDWYKGAVFAPYCDEFTPSGLTRIGWAADLDDRPCDKEWQQCIGRDTVEGFTPRGAVCLFDDDGALIWVAGSTEKWFAPEQTVEE